MDPSLADAQCDTAGHAAAMVAARVHAFGGPDVIRIEETGVPRPADDEILIAVHAAGVGPWDALIRAGAGDLPRPLPLTLGSDVSGVVVAVGARVGAFEIGQAVYGVANHRWTGAHAHYAACKAETMGIKPDRISHIEAASVPVVAAMAWQMLFEEAMLVPRQTVLVHGAAGNVGRFAVQMAQSSGLRVIASASGRDAAGLRALGADLVVGRDLALTQGVDAVLDLVGGAGQNGLFGLVRAGGMLVSAVSQPDGHRARRAGIRAGLMQAEVRTDVLDEITTRFQEGSLEAFVGTVLPLEEVARAHHMLEGRLPRAPGKIVLEIDRD